MNKQEFLDTLKYRLSDLPQCDVEERLTFYSEMIDDRMEEGLKEEESINEIGGVDVIVSQILSEMSLSKPDEADENPGSKHKMRAWEILLLVLGSPLWLSLLVAFFSVVFAGYVVLWSLIVSIWAVEIALVVCSVAGLISPVIYIIQNNIPGMIAIFGVGICCAGLAILLYFGCVAFSKGCIVLTKKLTLGIKSFFKRKENA